jgi:hypothetical protein
VTQGQIANILQERGELDEALRIRREEQLTAFTRLSRRTNRRIVDLFEARGNKRKRQA